MELPRIVVVLLAIIWVGCFVCFLVVSQLAWVSGNTFEYKLRGVQFPYVLLGLLASMFASSGLLWANYKGQDFRGAEQLIIRRHVRHFSIWLDAKRGSGRGSLSV